MDLQLQQSMLNQHAPSCHLVFEESHQRVRIETWDETELYTSIGFLDVVFGWRCVACAIDGITGDNHQAWMRLGD